MHCHTYIHTYIHRCMHAYVRKHTHTYTSIIHTYTCTQVAAAAWPRETLVDATGTRASLDWRHAYVLKYTPSGRDSLIPHTDDSEVTVNVGLVERKSFAGGDLLLGGVRVTCWAGCDTYTHAYIHTHTHAYTHIHTYAHMHTYTHAYIHSHIYTYTHTFIHTYICTYTYIHTHMHTYIRTHIHIYTHIHTHIHTP